MPTPILDTITEYETKALEFATSLQAPVVEAVGRVAETIGSRLPENRPELPVQPAEVVESQFAFAQKVLKAQHDFVTAVLTAAAPLLNTPVAPKVAPAKAAKAA